jgi:hypothetical protein
VARGERSAGAKPDSVDEYDGSDGTVERFAAASPRERAACDPCVRRAGIRRGRAAGAPGDGEQRGSRSERARDAVTGLAAGRKGDV